MCVALFTLWFLDYFPVGHVVLLQSAAVTTGFIAGWPILQKGLEPCLTGLRPVEETLHALVAFGALLTSLLFFTPLELDRLPEA